MAGLREVFNKEVVLSYQVEQPEAKTPFYESGAFTTSAQLRPLVTSGSETFKVPFINPLDLDLEANYSNTVYTDIAEPRGITASKSKGRMAFLNEGFLESRLERQLTGISPLKAMADTIDDYWAKQAENRALATLIGIRNLDQTNKVLTTDISLSTATGASGFSVDAFIDAEGTLDEAYHGIGAMVVHPLIATKLRKQQLIEHVTISSDLKPVQMYNGRRVIVSNRGTMIGTGKNAKFVTYLLGSGAFAVDSVAGEEDLEVGRTIDTGNGSGHTTLWTRRNMLIHPQGFSFVGAEETLTGGTVNEAISPSWQDLSKAENWQLDVKAEKVPVRFLVTNL